MDSWSLTINAEGDSRLHLLRVGECPVPDDATVLGPIVVLSGVDGKHGGGGEVPSSSRLQDTLKLLFRPGAIPAARNCMLVDNNRKIGKEEQRTEE